MKAGADAVTVNPYLGRDSLEPFLARADKGVVILCRTSNAGARDLQDLDVGGKKLYQHVAATAALVPERDDCLAGLLVQAVGRGTVRRATKPVAEEFRA